MPKPERHPEPSSPLPGADAGRAHAFSAPATGPDADSGLARRSFLKQARRAKAQSREAAARGWDASPITTARLVMDTWDVVKAEPWSLVVSDRIPWARNLWPATQFHQMLGGSGGQGVGYGAPASIGAALANRDKGLLSVTFQPDGDLMYAPGVLWTAADHQIPLHMVMHDNRGYYQEVMHLQRMAALHGRRPDRALIGNEIDRPASKG